MTVVLGSEAQGAETGQSAVTEKGIAIRVEAKCTGTVKVKKIKIKFSALGSGTNKVILGVREDSAGAVGAFMAETPVLTAAATTEGELTSEISVTNGTFYWLCLVPTEQTGTTCKVKSAAGETKKTTGLIKKISEGTWTGALLKYIGTEPGFWAEEVEGGTIITVTALVHGAGTATTPVAHGAIVNVADATGAGKVTASVAHGASAVAKVDGAGAPTASVAHGAIVSVARVDGAGRATVTLAGAVVVTALVHGAGKATASVAHIGTATALVHGAGAPSVSSAGVRTATAFVHGGGAVTASAAKVAPVAGSVHGAGRVTAAVAHGASATAQVDGGGSPRAVVSHTGIASALVHGGGAATAYLAIGAIVARVRGGGNATVVINLFVPSEQFPTKAPIEGHVALSRRGRLDRNKGHIDNPRAGRSGF